MRPHRRLGPWARADQHEPQHEAAGGVPTPMAQRNEFTFGRRHIRHTLCFAALCAALLGVAVVSTAGAKSAQVLGHTKHSPPPACQPKKPRNTCEAVGRVTGFPLVADGKKRPFNVHKSGHLVAWAIDVAKPTKPESNTLGGLFKSDQFGKAPTARLSIIKQQKHKHRSYRLVRQSPVVNLSRTLGGKELFTLNKPLKVRKGQIVALTYPTWAPNFAFNGISTHDNKWRGSRSKKEGCAPKSSDSKVVARWIRRTKPQTKVGSKRAYGCDYTGARLLYWAYFVPG
jgi:hypothetical protein